MKGQYLYFYSVNEYISHMYNTELHHVFMIMQLCILSQNDQQLNAHSKASIMIMKAASNHIENSSKIT